MVFDFIFVVLVYRNTEDLKEFFASLNVANSRVVVVNSYYDEKSEKEFHKIAELNGADYISVPNKGYGAGNDRGVQYALAHYDFRYLVISNADITIIKMHRESLDSKPIGIYAPSIRTLSGKQQNPHMPFYFSVIDRMKYSFFLKNDWNAIMFFCAINKVFRLLFLGLIRHINGGKVYSAHGAFVIIPKLVLDKIIPLYDENVFLFTEEENLAMNAKSHGIATYFVPEIEVRHKEDGSTSTISDKQREITRESFIAFYRKWYL